MPTPKPAAPRPTTVEAARSRQYADQSVGRIAALESLVALQGAFLDELLEATPLYDLGVGGWDHRYAASRILAAEGAGVTVLHDYGSAPTDLTGSGATLTNGGVPGQRVVSGIGTASTAYTGPAGTQPGTIAMIARQAATTGADVVRAHGVGIKRTGTGQWQLQGVGGGGYSLLGGTSGWHFIAAAVTDATTFRFRVDGVESTTVSAGGAFAAATPAALWLGGYTVLDIAEIVTWPTALSSSDLATVRAAMQANSGLI